MSSRFILIIGPSGSGKGTLLEILKEKHPEIFFPISATTRKPRPNENNGETYYFLTKEDFLKKRKNNEFLEYAEVHGGNFYGTLKTPILQALTEGKIVVREIDYQGFLSISKIIPKKELQSIFILPPSLEILKERIKDRAPISAKELDARMESLKKEMHIAKQCDIQIHTIDNDIEGSYKIFEDAIFQKIKQKCIKK
jgi:guanylate kinase